MAMEPTTASTKAVPPICIAKSTRRVRSTWSARRNCRRHGMRMPPLVDPKVAQFVHRLFGKEAEQRPAMAEVAQTWGRMAAEQPAGILGEAWNPASAGAKAVQPGRVEVMHSLICKHLVSAKPPTTIFTPPPAYAVLQPSSNILRSSPRSRFARGWSRTRGRASAGPSRMIFIGLVLSLYIAYAAFQRRSLTAAAPSAGGSGWHHVVRPRRRRPWLALVAFFLTSTALSKYRQSEKERRTGDLVEKAASAMPIRSSPMADLRRSLPCSMALAARLRFTSARWPPSPRRPPTPGLRRSASCRTARRATS